MNWQDLYKQRETIQGQLQALEKYKKQQHMLELQMDVVNKEINSLEQQLDIAREKVQKLEQPSILNSIREWKGTYGELLDEHVGQLAKLELQLIENQLMREDLQDDLVEVLHKQNLINESLLQETLEKLQAQMTEWLAVNAPAIASKQEEIIYEKELAARLVIEIDEAIAAGNEAEDALIAARQSLQSASNYSAWDTFLGGGFIATAVKHSKIDESNTYVHRAQIALQRFHNELLDIQELRHSELNVSVSGLVHFADYFFDDIFSAWSVHTKINESKERIQSVLDDVRNTLFDLQGKRYEVEQQLTLLEKQEQAIFVTQDL